MMFDEDLRLGVLKSLEKRWKKVDQDIFIVAVFLNPYIRAKLFRQEFLMEAQLYNIVEWLYERLMRCKADLGFMDAFDDYKRSRGEFSDENMSLAMMKLRFSEVVSHSFYFLSESKEFFRIPHSISSVSGHALTRTPSLPTMGETG